MSKFNINDIVVYNGMLGYFCGESVYTEAFGMGGERICSGDAPGLIKTREVTRETVRYGVPYIMAEEHVGLARNDVVYMINDDGSDRPRFSTDPNASRDDGYWVYLSSLRELETAATEPVISTLEFLTKGGEETMTDEETKRPEYIIIARNTEVFKKGGVFQNYGGYYAEVIDAYNVRQFGGNTDMSSEQADILLQKKVAVEAVRLNPEFVTLEQNEVLGKALEAMKKVPAKKTKAVASKVTNKKGK